MWFKFPYFKVFINIRVLKLVDTAGYEGLGKTRLYTPYEGPILTSKNERKLDV